MSTSPTLIVMAAGMGSRYGGLKQIDPLGPSGEIVLDYSVHDALEAGFDRVIFVIRKDIESEFRQVVGKKYENKINVDYAFQDLSDVPDFFTVPKARKKPWGTAHAVLAARDLVDSPFAALNADDFYGKESFKILGQYLKDANDTDGVADYSMVGFQLEQTLSNFGSVARGVCQSDSDGTLQSVVEHTCIEKTGDQIFNTQSGEKTELKPDDLVSMNMWGFTPSFMSHDYEKFSEFLRTRGHEDKSEVYIPSIVDTLIKEGRARCKVLPTQSEWFGVTYQQDRPFVQEQFRRLVDKGEYTSPMWNA